MASLLFGITSSWRERWVERWVVPHSKLILVLTLPPRGDEKAEIRQGDWRSSPNTYFIIKPVDKCKLFP